MLIFLKSSFLWFFFFLKRNFFFFPFICFFFLHIFVFFNDFPIFTNYFFILRYFFFLFIALCFKHFFAKFCVSIQIFQKDCYSAVRTILCSILTIFQMVFELTFYEFNLANCAFLRLFGTRFMMFRHLFGVNKI